MKLLLLFLPLAAPGDLDRLSSSYARAVRRVNEERAERPGRTREEELSRQLPKEAESALKGLLQRKNSPELFEALAACGAAALDLDRLPDFEKVRARLEKASPEHASRLGAALSRPRFLLRGIGLDREHLEQFAAALQAVLEAYDEVFGFQELSKVPGKKLRVRVHLEEKIVKPPYFSPKPPFHSEIDFPVVSARDFRSPTASGEFLFYGLCHELGHVVAMWGDRAREEDHHAWAHYTGVTVVEHLSKAPRRSARRSMLSMPGTSGFGSTGSAIPPFASCGRVSSRS